MKRTSKSVFFIVSLLILALSYTSFFGVYSYYGDRRDTIIRGAADIRWGIDIKGGIDVTFGPGDDVKEVTKEQMNSVQDVIAQRLVLQNITDYEIYSDAANRQVIVRFPWKEGEQDFDPATAIEELGKTAMLEFREGAETTTTKDADGNEIKKPSGKLILTGDDVDSAKVAVGTEKSPTEPVVHLTMKGKGKEAFHEATERLYNKGTISIWLDNEQISNPNVSAVIPNGVATISGGFTNVADATKLANLINSGALPFGIEVKSFGTIDPTMGTRALDVMVLAGGLAFLLISLYLLIYYRLPGFVAFFALLGQVAGLLMCVSGYFGFLNSFTLTLPGIAGIVLSIGMGVDANIITAERIREEIRVGKTIDGAIQSGCKNSFWAIFDGNVTNIIVAVVLMGVFGPPSSLWAKILTPFLFMFPASTTGAIYSFGYTLLVGIIFNFIMGVTASRLMMKSITRFKFLRKPWLLGGERK